MITVLIQTLLIASSGLLSMGSITLVILLLISDRGWRNGLAYALGYTTAYSLIGVFGVVVGYRALENSSGESDFLLPILQIVLGMLLLWLSQRNWRKPITENPEEPRLFSIVDKISPLKALGAGALVSLINIKNLALFLTALTVVIASHLTLAEKIIVALLAALVFCLSVLIPVLIYLVFPSRAQQLLKTIKQTINRHSRPISIWLPLIFGIIFVIKGITELP